MASTKDMTSVNQESYDSNEKNYYLGYQEADFKKPFSKYYNPTTPAINDEVQKGLSASPWASSIGENRPPAGCRIHEGNLFPNKMEDVLIRRRPHSLGGQEYYAAERIHFARKRIHHSA